MANFFDRLLGRTSDPKDGSGKIAKDRLQFVLVQDRINMPAERLQAMKAEILEVISKYVAVDTENVDFALSNRERNGLLIAEIPFLAPSAPVDDTDEDDATESEPTQPSKAAVAEKPEEDSEKEDVVDEADEATNTTSDLEDEPVETPQENADDDDD